MSIAFYFKLAFTNLKKNHKTYIPYLLTCIITIMMFYCLSAVARNSGLDQMNGSESLKVILKYAVWVTGIFAAVFLFYTNSFLIKQRKKEFGVYQVLGMDKRNLIKMEVCETLITIVVSLTAGLSMGMLFGRLMFLLLLKMVQFPVPLRYSVEPAALLQGALLFLGIFAATLLTNLFQVGRVKPVDLLKGENTGEKEPKTKWLFVLIGIMTLAGGYYIALATEDPLVAIFQFFIAVILVIIGTYCLFMTGSIALLKILKKKKKYYYKTRHFISVSGMIYRMKQNAVGLANICIMSTIVLVLISMTVSLYVGIDDIVSTRYPTDFKTELYMPEEGMKEKADQIVKEEAESENVKIKNLAEYTSGSLACMFDGKDTIEVDMTKVEGEISNVAEDYYCLLMLTVADYNALQGKNEKLSKEQALVFVSGPKAYTADTLKLDGKTYEVKAKNTKTAVKNSTLSSVIKTIYVVMSDEAQIENLVRTYGLEGANGLSYTIEFDLIGEKEAMRNAMKNMEDRLSEEIGESAAAEIRQEHKEDFLQIDGGFLFLGIFVGALFLMATVLIIYYKQISEGYSDRERYQIMQKVGMDKREVVRSIKSQVMTVFFLPLAGAVLHLAVAFKLMAKLLEIMYLTNVPLFAACTGVTILVFVVFYAIVFAVTSREYYKIVR
ncbi:ABC transporter permease [Faecalicatena acetigenes]|uniref:ABC transporter permease n=1 Tax=Faecalicatena acetigenes TaxID=2981790 RepID=A0ABT2TFP1_9FIRM|nr:MULTISPECIES: ABC transporter permease [Lachnospiraceae]MCU6748617.1 ABC transporter permease [Faecalicatena acetigenes]SCI54582.1 FtsX-like permease family [uncultured Clostridium sp.]